MKIIDFQNGTTKVNEDTFNEFQNNIEIAISDITSKKAKLAITEDSEKGAIVTIPLSYKVGIGALDVYFKGERLIICTGSDETTGSYLEVGTVDSISNQIKITDDWNLDIGDVIEIVVRGEYTDDTE